MTANILSTIEKIESQLWESADQLRANSKLTSSEYCMPVLGIIFLRHASNRYENALAQIKADQAAGKMPNRPLVKSDFIKRRALLLPEKGRYDYLLKLQTGESFGAALVEAMNVIEDDFEPLKGQLPKDYDKFDDTLLEDILRTFDSQELRTASGDVFGRIYEYFLMKFAMQGAQDNGEFFTPPSLVQTIVNVIEPDHGIVFDPACGSGGMFVQNSHFIESHGQDTGHKVTFYEDVHPIFGKCDFVMANPPFNVDMVDAKVKDDRRLPFGLPGVNKAKKVSNGNYLWISYFHRQIVWLQDRFPDAVMLNVPGLCKVVDRAEIGAADWSLTPGRYVGVAPPEVDEDFDFEQTLRDIHVELKDLNAEAIELAARVQENFEELGV